MSETSVKIIKNEIRCRDGTVPKTVGTRSHCKVWLRACNNLPQPPPYILFFWGCGRLLHALNHTLQWLLVPTVFGTVPSLHLISFLMIFTLVIIESTQKHKLYYNIYMEHGLVFRMACKSRDIFNIILPPIILNDRAYTLVQ